MAHRLIESLREVSPRNAARVGISHLFLLVACLWGGLPYLFLQALLAIELILISVATIPLYPGRSAASHFWDLTKLTAGLTFALVFIAAGYAVTNSGGGDVMDASMQRLRGLGLADVVWALAYLVLHIAISLRDVLRSPDPRLAWTKNRLLEAGTTFVALFLMVFVGFFLGLPLVSGLAVLGLDINVDAVLSTLMIAVRYVVALVMTLMTDTELEKIARNPYVDS